MKILKLLLFTIAFPIFVHANSKVTGCDSIWKYSVEASEIFFATLPARAGNAVVQNLINNKLGSLTNAKYPRTAACIQGEYVMKAGSSTEVDYLRIDRIEFR